MRLLPLGPLGWALKAGCSFCRCRRDEVLEGKRPAGEDEESGENSEFLGRMQLATKAVVGSENKWKG